LALSLTAGTAWGEDAPSEQAQADARRADAKDRYEQGVEAYSAGRFKDAVDHFLAADKLSPSAPLSFNIARAYEKRGPGMTRRVHARERSATYTHMTATAALRARLCPPGHPSERMRSPP
jgi:hypothetical protein